MSLKAVIFDVDGVLVQSMERHHEAYAVAFAELGLAVAPEEVYANEGRSSREVLESLAVERGLGLSKTRIDELNEIKQRTFYGFGPLPLYPGVRELIARIKDAPLFAAAVTGTNRKNVDQHLGALTGRFDTIVTSNDVKNTKPHPEPYLMALEKLDISADDAFVVENATLGVRSAKAAGIRVIGVTSTLTEAPLRSAGADFIIPRVADAWTIVEEHL